MHINRDNIVIRSAVAEDAQTLSDWWNDGAVMAHAGYPKGLGISVEEVIAQIEDNQNRLSQRCIIEVDGTRVGECSYRLAENLAEIGIKVCNTSYQNRGLGSKILKMLIIFLFSDQSINQCVKLEKIILDTDAKNLRAQHVYEKLGFKKLRTNIDIWKDQLGEMQSSIDYELPREVFLEQDYA